MENSFANIKVREVRTVTYEEMYRLLESRTVEQYRKFPMGFYHVWFIGQENYVVYEVVDL